MQDQEIHQCQDDILSYKHMVVGEQLGENGHRPEQETIEELFWEPRRKV